MEVLVIVYERNDFELLLFVHVCEALEHFFSGYFVLHFSSYLHYAPRMYIKLLFFIECNSSKFV